MKTPIALAPVLAALAVSTALPLFSQEKTSLAGIGVGAKPIEGAEVILDGTRETLDAKWTYWTGPRFASALPIKWPIVADPVVPGATALQTDDPAAVAGADAVYTDAWISMGQQQCPEKIASLRKLSVTPELMQIAAPSARFMHCLPAHRGEEVVDAVIDGPQSIVFDQAENRMHAQKALMEYLLLGRIGA